MILQWKSNWFRWDIAQRIAKWDHPWELLTGQAVPVGFCAYHVDAMWHLDSRSCKAYIEWSKFPIAGVQRTCKYIRYYLPLVGQLVHICLKYTHMRYEQFIFWKNNYIYIYVNQYCSIQIIRFLQCWILSGFGKYLSLGVWGLLAVLMNTARAELRFKRFRIKKKTAVRERGLQLFLGQPWYIFLKI